MPSIFESHQRSRPRMSAFDLSREQKLSCTMADLVPTYLEEVVPGDQFRVRSEIMLRVAPMLAPLMHRVNVYMHYFFVPNRLVWNQWEDFITGGQDGKTEPVMPTFNFGNNASDYSKLADYMGLPTPDNTDDSVTISRLPFRAYHLIWNEYYRDPNLMNEIDVESMLDGDLLTIRKRAWEKDYFTSALPWQQRGDEVGIPVDFEYMDVSQVKAQSGADAPASDIIGIHDLEDGELAFGSTNPITAGRIENLATEAVNVNINDLRRSNALQQFLEKQARGGYRYIETILNHFGVHAKDYRLQRPEYLGGGKQPVQISEVLNTTGTDQAPQGDMTGHGIAVGGQNSFQTHIKEHGYVFGIMSVMPKTGYFQGIPRHFSRRDKYDYYWPEFAHLGEQEVKMKELYFQPGGNNEDTFGYQQRYAEYKYGLSTIHGDFRGDLDFWHMARRFDTPPALNKAFIEADPTKRIFAVQDGTDELWIQLYHDVKARRPMPYFANPRL